MNSNFKSVKLISVFAFLIITLLTSCQEVKEQEPWVDLFDGKTLNGWTQKRW